MPAVTHEELKTEIKQLLSTFAASKTAKRLAKEEFEYGKEINAKWAPLDYAVGHLHCAVIAPIIEEWKKENAPK